MPCVPRCACAPRRIGGDTSALSETVGSILLVAMTVVAAAGMGALVFTFRGPAWHAHAHLAATLDPGAGGWGTGDEQVRVAHLGGDALDAAATTLVLRVNQGTATVLSGPSLGGAFADGKLAIGEVQSRTLNLRATDVLAFTVIVRSPSGGSDVVAQGTLLPAGA